MIDVPQLLDAVSGTGLVLRDASIELVALLEAGDLDCAFEYESVARQHHLPFVALPAQIDLGSQRYAAEYAKVAVAIAFQRFATRQAALRRRADRLRRDHPEHRPATPPARRASSPFCWARGAARSWRPTISRRSRRRWSITTTGCRRCCARCACR